MSRFIFAILTLSFLITSCEKVLNIPLNTAETRTVIEGVINDEMGNNYVLLSRTHSVYTQANFPKISDAVITVTDDLSNVYAFTEVDSVAGRYTCPTLKAEPKRKYELSVNIDGEFYTADSYAPPTPKIDSISTIQEDYGLSQILGYVPHTVYVHTTDNAATEDYYRFKIWINGDESIFVYIGNDDFINGQSFNAPFLGELADDGDSIQIVQIACDEAYYRYQYSLPSAQGGSGGTFAVAPGNPVGNIEGDMVVGYFTALTTDTMSYVIPY
jgi:hypothetical protein